MKNAMFAALVLVQAVFTASTFASEKIVKFVEPKYITELETFPTMIKATFDVDCNQIFLKSIREDLVDQNTGKVTIVIGGLITEDTRIDCTGASKQVVADAGSGYSSGKYEISKILR